MGQIFEKGGLLLGYYCPLVRDRFPAFLLVTGDVALLEEMMIGIQCGEGDPAPKDVGGVLLIVDQRLQILFLQELLDFRQEHGFHRLSSAGSQP